MSTTRKPPGFFLTPDFISAKTESKYLAYLDSLVFQPTEMRGWALRRQILAFGTGFGTNFQSTVAAPLLPRRLYALRTRAASWAGCSASELSQALVQKYPKGATIGWHVDADIFGAPIIGISFGGTAQLMFRPANRTSGRRAIEIPPRSVYRLEGPSRSTWLHSIAPVPASRYSITFRSLAA
ncbi:MAG: alpha-ketoglutarate-dependent dioxygenase AlkB [Thermoanaerobaculia bacterium]